LKTLIALLIVIITTPLAAQSTEIGVSLVSQINNGGGRFVEGQDVTASFANGSGFGLSLARAFNPRISGELAVFRTSSNAQVNEGSTRIANLGDLELTHIIAMARYHFLPGRRVDVFVAGGLAYVDADDLDSADLRALDLAPVRIDSKTVGTVGAGLVFSVTPRIGISVDARYIPFDISARANDDPEDIKLDLNPVLVGVGIKFKF
jgi:outer membrane protein W